MNHSDYPSPIAKEGLPPSLNGGGAIVMPTSSAAFHLTEALPNFIVAAPAMRELVSQVIAVCDSHAPVLITGETGTGKELLARAIHLSGNRRGR